MTITVNIHEAKTQLSKLLKGVANGEQALGQYMLYERILERREPERALFLAIPIAAYKGVLDSAVGRLAVTDFHIRLIVFDPEKERVEQWIE